MIISCLPSPPTLRLGCQLQTITNVNPHVQPYPCLPLQLEPCSSHSVHAVFHRTIPLTSAWETMSIRHMNLKHHNQPISYQYYITFGIKVFKKARLTLRPGSGSDHSPGTTFHFRFLIFGEGTYFNVHCSSTLLLRIIFLYCRIDLLILTVL